MIIISEALEAQNKIAKWLERFGYKIWFDKINPWNYPTFTGSSSKFDLLVLKDNRYSAIEVKPGDKNQHLLDGFEQILKYAGEYYAGRSKYIVDEKQVKIENFLFATKYSDRGFLYDKEESTNPISGDALSTIWNQGEYIGTLTFSRLLWRMWDKLTSEIYGIERVGDGSIILQPKPSIGIIVAKFFWDKQRLSTEPYMYLNGNRFVNMIYE